MGREWDGILKIWVEGEVRMSRRLFSSLASGRWGKVLVVALTLVVLSYVGLGYVMGKTGEDKTYRSLSVFSEVLQHIQQDYVEEPNLPLVTSGALHGLLESLDPLSSYLSPREYTEYKQKVQNGSKGEVGLSLSKRFGYIIVVAVLPDSPAQKAGLRPGDILEAISGFTTREMSVGQAQILLAGDAGRGVKVFVVRRGRSETQEMDLVREHVSMPKVTAEKVEPEVGYLRLVTLEAGKANEIREKLAQFEKQGIQKLVLDLRDNAKGDPNEAVAVARLFLPAGTIGSLKGQTVAREEFVAEPAKVVWKHPITVLINSSTSGAAEVLAAAIGENKRGEVVGTRTYGSASEQKLFPLDDGAALVLTVALYYTPSGKAIPDEGVKPTVEVRAGSDELDADDDSPSAQPGVRPASPEDPVLRKAIEILKGGAAKAMRVVPVRKARRLPEAA